MEIIKEKNSCQILHWSWIFSHCKYYCITYKDKKFVVWLHIIIATPPTLHFDNIRATYLNENLVFHSKANHLALDYHFLSQHVQSSQLKVSYISTKDKLVDGPSIPLARQRFWFLQLKVSIAGGLIFLQEHAKNKEQQINLATKKQIKLATEPSQDQQLHNIGADNFR